METAINPSMLSGDMRVLLANLITSYLQYEKERKNFKTILLEFVGKLTIEVKAPTSVKLPFPPRAAADLMNPHLNFLTKEDTKPKEPKNCNGVPIMDDMKEVLDKYVSAGYLDADYKPIGLSLTGRATLASVISMKVWKRYNWKFFEKLWGKKNLSASYNKACFQKKSKMLQAKFEKIIK